MLAVAGKVCQAATQENLVSLLNPGWTSTTTELPVDTVSISNSSNIDANTVLRRANAAPRFNPDSGSYDSEESEEEEVLQPKPKGKLNPRRNRNKKNKMNLLKKSKVWQKPKNRQKKWKKKEQKREKKVKNQKKVVGTLWTSG